MGPTNVFPVKQYFSIISFMIRSCASLECLKWTEHPFMFLSMVLGLSAFYWCNSQQLFSAYL